MVRALHVLADELIDLLVGLNVRARLDLPASIPIERRLRKDLTCQPYARAHLEPVVRVRHVVEEDLRLRERLGRGEPHPALGFGAHGSGVRLESMLARER